MCKSAATHGGDGAGNGAHPQTARYRLARLRELMGDDLDDPDARFELEIALRATTAERPDPPYSRGSGTFSVGGGGPGLVRGLGCGLSR